MRVGATSWKSNHPTKRFGQLPKRSKPRDIPYTPLKNLIIQVAIDDAGDSRVPCRLYRDSMLSRFPSARHRSYQSHRGRGGGYRHPQARNHATSASYRPISLLSGLGKLSRKFSKLALAITSREGLIIDEQFGFRPAHSCPQQVLRLVGMSALTRQDVLSEQEFLKAPPSPLLYSAYTNDVPRPSSSGVQLALFADDTALFYGRNRSPIHPPPSEPLTS
ncbi:hypothetical protein EVAR_51424_1 [Eumeta japonica]|uniref:Uncharacterized protein n=1 Tax=Eumeta variegata TaxID=151549 RepID=A0A4C1XW69_EUMVA|nr:hypothetical protein EVAR_51424_1 [Eumeta japonica]